MSTLDRYLTEETLVQSNASINAAESGCQGLPKPSSAEEGLRGYTDPKDAQAGRSAQIDAQHPCTEKEKPCRKSWAQWGCESVTTCGLIPSLVIQAFATGILDATTYADFSTFASNQTGNTIALCVAATGAMKILLLLTGISFASFLLGALIFGHLGHCMGIRKRLWILTSTTYQILALVVAAILLSPTGPRVTQVGGKHQWVALALFANMSGAQVANARQSGSQELPTAPMTSSYVDLMADKYLLVGFKHPKAGPRNRRLIYIFAMISGGFLGAALHRHAGSWPVIVVTILLKVVVVGFVCVAPAE